MNYLQLGRYGDIINLLPLLWHDNLHGDRSTLVVGDEFASIMDCVSYADRLVYGNPTKGTRGICEFLPDATRVCAAKLKNVRVAQVFLHPKASTTACSSFAKESYRLIGREYEWGMYPLVLDAIPPAEIPPMKRRVMYALDGISSPLPQKANIEAMLKIKCPTAVDLSKVRTANVAQLLAYFEKASVLVCCDTVHVWLARAAKCPVIFLQNDGLNGWRGSPPPPQAISTHPYSTVRPLDVMDDIERVGTKRGRMVLVIDKHGDEERHRLAEKTWKCDVPVIRSEWGRTAKDIGDKLPLPFFKDLLLHALLHAHGNDYIVWTNSDVQLGKLDKLGDHVTLFGACSARRDPAHIGRELFAFSCSWLRDRLNDMPDVILAAPKWDLVIARWIRREMGIPDSTLETLAWDMFPCEITADIKHPEHESGWNTPERLRSPAAAHNEYLWTKRI